MTLNSLIETLNRNASRQKAADIHVSIAPSAPDLALFPAPPRKAMSVCLSSVSVWPSANTSAPRRER